MGVLLEPSYSGHYRISLKRTVTILEVINEKPSVRFTAESDLKVKLKWVGVLDVMSST